MIKHYRLNSLRSSRGSMSDVKPDTFEFFYFPTSFSSQKILFALYEKDICFKPRLVSLFSGQHNEPWYVQMNPEGCHIPILKHGQKVIVEPKEITNYISSCAEATGGHPLVPSLDSELGRDVDKMRTKLDTIPVDVLTYGIVFHPHLSTSGCQLPGAVQRSIKDNFAERLSVLTELATQHPDLRDSYLTKSQMSAHKFELIAEEERVRDQLDDIQPLFTDIELQLQKIKEVSSDIPVSDELWLFGPMFTAADISLAVLLNRLVLLGLEGRYFPQEKCPAINQYYELVRKRPTYRLIEDEINNLRMTLIWENLKTASPYILGTVGLGAVAGAGYLAYKKLS